MILRGLCPLFLYKMIDKQTINKLAEHELKGTDKFLVDITVNPGNKITVILDSDSSI